MRRSTLVVLLLLIALLNICRAQSEVLQTGDIVFLTGNCTLCVLIQQEEKCPFSHLGIVIMDENSQPLIAEAADTVTLTPLGQFVARRHPGTVVAVRRYNFWNAELEGASALAYRLFFGGLSYDPKFLWSNRDEKGEMLYCSEFVAKFYNILIRKLFQTKPMHYEVNRSYWEAYFAPGLPPDGRPGISPCDILRHEGFRDVSFDANLV